ncbi:hypothetical protein AA13595_2465 [Gluconacetobacter johannae DSM 13595]|uniref:Uncharacterized protein n=1 Tax=Gluconacetobacter johannae TaxID=112140 RepID=A0A7W4J602_9PROT|nr:hypothetical protein [Gluconacetobacter johannae]MBB2175398.1 hypothetical protein [Gluconacetobacter johannae]GBQ88726.1 hypothetical protein AA13595_2465 [Gluconacetobacter johannae DSM 13595]
MDAFIAARLPGRTGLMAGALLSMTLLAGGALAAPPAPRHADDALSAPIHSTLGNTTPAPAAPENAEAPPPPDGYQVVQDEDVSAQAYSPAVTAVGGPGLPSIEARQTPREPNSVPSHFSVFGVPVKFNAPVTPPYNAAFTYSTYAGQPGRGWDAVGAEGAAGQP